MYIGEIQWKAVHVVVNVWVGVIFFTVRQVSERWNQRVLWSDKRLFFLEISSIQSKPAIKRRFSGSRQRISLGMEDGEGKTSGDGKLGI